MTLLIKICGLTTPEALDAAIAAGADMAGFVFFSPSPRNLRLQQAKRLFAQARERIAIGAVLVDPEQRLIDEICGLKPDFLQLHGTETPARLAAIKADARPVAVVKGIGIASAADLDHARAFARAADRLLLDAKAEPGAALPGGNGLPFDWRLIAGADLGAPYMLSGGLTADNVADAIRLIGGSPGFLGIDVSSGVERAPGDKDPDKITAFVRAARAAERNPAMPRTAHGV
jgi:phosphoribosylanthranilate isomerase